MREVILFMNFTIVFSGRKLSFLPVSGAFFGADSFRWEMAKVMGYAEKRSGSCPLKYSRPVQTGVRAPACVMPCLIQRVSYWSFLHIRFNQLW